MFNIRLSKFPIFIFLIFFSVNQLFAQEVDEFKEMFHEAEFFFYTEANYERALMIFEELDKMERGKNANVRYYLASCYLRMPGQMAKAIPYLESAVQNTSENYSYGYREKRAPIDAIYYLGHSYHINEQFENAIILYKEYLEKMSAEEYLKVDFIHKQIESIEIAKEYMKSPVGIQKLPTGDAFNDLAVTYSPAISGDGKVMAYTSNIGDASYIFVSRKEGNVWSEPEDISVQLEIKRMGVSASLSYDGNKMLIAGQNVFESDIYLSECTGGKWSKVEKLRKSINTKYWESGACFSPDGNKMYFSSNRKGGHGELDIYVSELNDKGKWGEAVNLGTEINSPFHEDNPVLSADGKSLYFSSQGHYNMGGYDLFVSKLDENGNWSVPVNMGYPLNTCRDDVKIVPAGEEGLYCYAPEWQDEGSFGKELVFFQLAAGEADAQTNITGTVSKDDNYPDFSGTQVKVVESATGDTLEQVQVDPETGHYSISMKEGNYSFVFSGAGYETAERSVNIDNTGSGMMELDQELKAAKTGEEDYIYIKNILFDFNDHNLNREASMELERAIDILKLHPELQFDLEGHTDDIGSADYNLELSQKRARSVLDYLVERGLDRSRFRTKGYGEIVAMEVEDAEAPSMNDADRRRLNRRVEFKVIGGEDLIIENNVYVPSLFKDNKSLKYTVVVMKVKEKLPADFFDQYELEELEYVREEKAQDGYIYTIGVFLNKNEAFKLTGDLRSIGLTEARVLDQHELDEMLVEKGRTSGVFVGSSASIPELPMYTIQVLALKWLIDTDEPRYKKYRGAKAYKSGNYYRYSIGEYKGYSRAKPALEEFKKQGHKDAFIRRLSDYGDM